MRFFDFLYNDLTITVIMVISILFACISLIISFIQKKPSVDNLHHKKSDVDRIRQETLNILNILEKTTERTKETPDNTDTFNSLFSKINSNDLMDSLLYSQKNDISQLNNTVQKTHTVMRARRRAVAGKNYAFVRRKKGINSAIKANKSTKNVTTGKTE